MTARIGEVALTGAERARRYRELHPERVAAQIERAKEQRREASRRWREKNRGKDAARAARWRAANREQTVIQAATRRARAAGGDFTRADWAELLDKFDHRCAYCSTDGPLEIEHVVPLSRGGRHTKDNVVPACRSCNASKGSKLLAEWVRVV